MEGMKQANTKIIDELKVAFQKSKEVNQDLVDKMKELRELYKEKNGVRHLLKPKALIRYSPNHMRKDSNDFNLYENGINIFSVNRLITNENFESGSNSLSRNNQDTQI